MKRAIVARLLNAIPPQFSVGMEERGFNIDNPRGQPESRRIILFAVIALGLALRVWGIGFGLPHEFTADEVHEILRAFKLGAGEYQWSFGKGGLYLLLFVEYGLIFAASWLLGWVANARDFAIWYVLDPSVFYLAGRLTVALMGALTCLVVYFIGTRVCDRWVGLGAAFIGATSAFHGVHSHIINVDVGTTFALWSSILVYLRYEEKREYRWLIAASMLAAISIAFKLPGGIVLFVLFLAIGSNAKTQSYGVMLKEAGVVLSTTVVTLTLIAPEWMTSLGALHENFSQIVGRGSVATDAGGENLRETIDSITILGGDWSWYVMILVKNYNIALTLTALLGAGLGFWRRERWPMIWSVLSAVFLGTMFAADRGPNERYLLPIMPGLWLLSSIAVVELSQRRWWLVVPGLACVVALPLVVLVRQNYEWTKTDTRVIAKRWIEANLPAGSKILIDGMRYRFIQSPPLWPDQVTVARLAAQAGGESELISQTGAQSYLPGEAGWGGASRRTWTLYAEAIKRVKGPKYALHSTVYGLGVEDLTYYIEACFDYIIVSSYNSNRYISDFDRKRFPKSAQFYSGLNSDSRFRVVYSVAPIPWERPGPVITVYKVPQCRTNGKRATDS
jgi:4-amino-4-deoxy-L-arabinose transferase-like glycosyltransferase